MFDIQGQFQASIFTNAGSIKPTSEIITTLLNLFKDKGLIPGSFQEISPAAPPQMRLMLSSATREWQINFAGNRIDIKKNAIENKGKNLGTIDGFLNEALDIFSKINNSFSLKANRISLVTSGLLPEQTKDKLNSTFFKLFSPIEFYKNNHPFEWSSSLANCQDLNINGKTEIINVITAINRVSGEMIDGSNLLNIDRIEVNFDINTKPDNEDFRFNNDDIKDFYNQVTKIRSILINQIKEIAYE